MSSVSTDRRQGVNSGAAVKVPVRAATTANITLSGEQTVDGVALVTGDRCLVKNQTSSVNNGVYVVDTGSWTRAIDFDGTYDIVKGTFVHVLSGGTLAGSWWEVSTTNPVIGTSSLAFTQTLLGDASTVSFLQAGTGAVARTSLSKMRDIFSVQDFGAVGDNATDDTAAINAAGLAVFNAGGGTVMFDGSKTYALGRRVVGDQNEGGILLYPGVNWDGNNCELRLTNNCHFFVGYSADAYFSWTTKATITADVASGATTFTVDSNAGFSIGDDVFVRLGDDATDTNETKFWMLAKVSALPAGQITLDRVSLQAVTVAGIVNANNKRIFRIPTGKLLKDFVVRNFVLNNDQTGSANAEGACNIVVARDGLFENIEAINPGPGFIRQFCEGVHLKNVSVPQCAQQGGHTAKGRAFTTSSCYDCNVDGWTAAGLNNVVAIVEFGSKGCQMRGGKLSQERTGTPTLFNISNGSELSSDELTIYGRGAFTLYDEGSTTGNSIKFRNTTMRITSAPVFAGIPGWSMLGWLSMNIAGTEEWYNLDLPYSEAVAILLSDGMNNQYGLPINGLIGSIEAWISSSASSADFDSFLMSRNSGNGSELKATFAANQWKIFGYNSQNIIGTNAGTHWTNRAENIQFLVDTAAAGVTGANKQLIVRITGYPRSTTGQAASSVTPTGLSVLRLFPKNEFLLTGSKTFDPANLADGAGETTTVTCTGAIVGDFCEASFSNDLQGILLTSWCSAADTVSVRFQNETGGAIDLASGTLRVRASRN